jgi:predicted SnoaL-like aldol condensation-catalyzing enzyme
MKNLIFALALVLPTSVLADNKQVVRDFYETALVKHKPAEAMKKFVGDKYIQHNPHVKDGPEPLFRDRYLSS